MKPVWKFRLFALIIFVMVGGISGANLVAEFLRPAPSPLPSKTSQASTPEQIASASRVAAIAPFRTDLTADYAAALAGRALKSEYPAQAQGDELAKEVVQRSLKMGPHDSRMWLILALLQARTDLDNSLVAESLKMSYLTGPNRAELIPTRLDIVTVSNSLNDAELRELARGDVRAILTQLPGQRQALIDDYARASSAGKAFLEESARTFDPRFADTLRSGK